jgi:L-alanine-DL-glutamate epimerase-like enolase superfamily enzyme
MDSEHRIERVDVALYTIPTEQPEADGTLAWDRTSMVVVRPRLGSGCEGLGFAYGDSAAVALARDLLAGQVVGLDIRDTGAAWQAMVRAIRNLGRPGIASMAVAAVDIALWDTLARSRELGLHRLLGAVRDRVPVYGSGGFTTYDIPTLLRQMSGWVEQGIPRVKMKIGESWGSDEARDCERIAAVRDAVGDGVELYVDANGAYGAKQALRLGRRFFEEWNVSWFEEPVSSDDLAGLAHLRAALPMEVTAGEYGYDLTYFARMLDAGAVDVLQADVGRCAGITEWLRVAALCAARQTPLSAHCGPSIHAHVACAAPTLRHIEYFHDHTRIDHLCFDGVLEPENGCLVPDDERPGLGLSLRDEAERFRVA